MEICSSQPIGIYVHIPYCIKKCPYCDFNSYTTGNSSIPESEYTNALIKELEFYVGELSLLSKPCKSIFFGGGTPSLFSPESFSLIIEQINKFFLLSKNTEITIEANPGSIHEDLGKEKLKSFRNAGINRLSMGVQSFSNEKLKFLGRVHTAEDTCNAIENVIEAGFDNFNLDLMFAVGTEKLHGWSFDLEKAASFNPTHISAYGLTIEPGTEFGTLAKRKALTLCKDSAQADMYKFTQTFLEERGYKQYEISNYAKHGFECRHNLGYWLGSNYLGLGAGACGFYKKDTTTPGIRWTNIKNPQKYISTATRDGAAHQEKEVLSLEQAKLETLLLRLRTTYGLDIEDYNSAFGEEFFTKHEQTLSKLKNQKLIEIEDDTISLTKEGFLFADYVITSF